MQAHTSAHRHGQERRTNHRIRQLFDDVFQRTSELSRQVAGLADQLVQGRTDINDLRAQVAHKRPSR
jgi:hypothetical protein